MNGNVSKNTSIETKGWNPWKSYQTETVRKQLCAITNMPILSLNWCFHWGWNDLWRTVPFQVSLTITSGVEFHIFSWQSFCKSQCSPSCNDRHPEEKKRNQFDALTSVTVRCLAGVLVPRSARLSTELPMLTESSRPAGQSKQRQIRRLGSTHLGLERGLPKRPRGPNASVLLAAISPGKCKSGTTDVCR